MTPTDLPIPSPLFEIFWEQHRQKIMLVIVALMVVVLLVAGVLLLNRSHRLAADELLATATDAAGWQKVVDRYPRSGAAANALLLLAAGARDEHHLDQSNALYSRFLEKFSQHPLAISSLLGRAMNDDDVNPQVAIDQFQQAALAYPKSYGTPFALMSEARILTRLGKTEEAKRVLGMISSQYPDSLVVTVMMRRGSGRQ